MMAWPLRGCPYSHVLVTDDDLQTPLWCEEEGEGTNVGVHVLVYFVQSLRS